MDPGGQGGRKGDPNRVHAFLAYLSFNEQLDDTLDGLGGTDPLGSFRRVPRGGRSVHPVSPRDASFGMGAPWDGRSANPMDSGSGYRGSGERGQRSHGWSLERTHPYNRQWVGSRGSEPRVMGAQRGPPGADLSVGPRVGSRHGNLEGRDGALQDGRGPSMAFGRGGAAVGLGSAAGPGAEGPTSNTPSHAGAVGVGRGSVGPRGK